MQKITVLRNQLNDGKVEIHGYKHAMVQIICAAIALNIPVLITNAPLVDDTFVFQEIIIKAGGICTIEDHKFYIDPREMKETDIDQELSQKIHGSLYLMPAFATRFGRFSFGESGGCQIGSLENKGKRPVDHMLDVMKQFGTETHFDEIMIVGERKVLHNEVLIDIMSFSDSKKQSTTPKISGATKTALLCGIGSQQCTILNPYLKTDVQDLIRFLRQCGYQIEFSKEAITMQAPISKPQNDICLEFQLTECVSEIMTYISLAIHTDINLSLKIKNVELIKKGLSLEFELLEKMGVNFSFNSEGIFIKKTPNIESINIDVTNDSIQSDHHPFFALMLLRGSERSTIREFVWKDRFAYVNELKKLGGELHQEENVLSIFPSKLTQGNQTLVASDTRAAAILLLASLTANAPTEIENIHHAHRGYENLLGSIESLGATLIQEMEALV